MSDIDLLQKYTEQINTLYPINSLSINALGLAAEAGEFANKVKKICLEYKNFSQEDLAEELAHVVFHLVQSAECIGCSFEDVIKLSSKYNIEKNKDKAEKLGFKPL